MMGIFQEIKALQFPLGSYVVVGSGVLEAHGIRKARNIDIVVKSELYEACKKAGWHEQWYEVEQKYGLRRNDKERVVELQLTINKNNFQPTTTELIERADIINGVVFASLEDLLAFKKDHNRSKDKVDIQLIEQALIKA